MGQVLATKWKYFIGSFPFFQLTLSVLGVLIAQLSFYAPVPSDRPHEVWTGLQLIYFNVLWLISWIWFHCWGSLHFSSPHFGEFQLKHPKFASFLNPSRDLSPQLFPSCTHCKGPVAGTSPLVCASNTSSFILTTLLDCKSRKETYLLHPPSDTFIQGSTWIFRCLILLKVTFGASQFSPFAFTIPQRWNLLAQQVVLGTFLLVFILVFLLYLGNTNQNNINWRCKSLQCDILAFVLLAFVYECDSFAFINYQKLVLLCLCKWLWCRCLRSHFQVPSL